MPEPHSPVTPEATLDPTTPEQWKELRALGHRMLDDMFDHLASVRERPAWQPMPEDVVAALGDPNPPGKGIGPEATYRDFVKNVLPYPNGNYHPRFWGWVQGQGTVIGMLADMLASGFNPNVAGFNQAPARVEEQVIAWLAGLMGMPSGTSGLLVSSGTMGNVLAIPVARYAKARELGWDVRQEGLQSGRGRMVFYGSTETHGWAGRAADVLGFGRDAYRVVATDGEYRMDLKALAAAVATDRAAGNVPFCVIGTAGTVNTGATDDLPGVAAFCRRERLWFHVDGAFGAFARLSKELVHIVDGIEQADSLACDLHKWMSVNYDSAALLVRDAQLHRQAFANSAAYLAGATRGVIAGGLTFADLGIDLSRSFKALKAWMMIKSYGVEAFARIVEKNVAQARHLAQLVEADPELELLAPVPLNLVCFRYRRAELDDDTLNQINAEVLLRLHERGIAVPSGTTIAGRYAIRVANCNHRSRSEDFDLLADAVVRLGREVLAERAVVTPER